MQYKQVYESWLNNPHIDEATKDELIAIANNELEIEDRFYRTLEFGTGGLRGVIGAGTNRMNDYVIQMASQGFANFIIKNNSEPRSIVIAHDSRRKSKEFCLATARVMAANGIKAYIYEDLRSTPELSFAVRYLKASAGIVITASHNPPEYNGYKVYGDDGCQLLPELADQVIEEVTKVSDPSMVKILSEESALDLQMLEVLDYTIDQVYLKGVKSKLIQPELFKTVKDAAIVFTPLHGTGGRPVTVVAKELGFKGLVEVTEQMIPNGEFPTVSYPNPEEEKAFELGVEYAQKAGALAIIATDPDCDRMGILVLNKEGKYEKITGNQTGALLLDYMCSQSAQLPSNPFAVNTIVSSKFGADVAAHYGVEMMSVLTGFKYIGEKIKRYEDGSKNFIFGYEESYGYLTGTDVRDKDAVISSLLAMEMILYYHSEGKTLLDRLEELFGQFGYYLEDLVSLSRKGKTGMEQIAAIMNYARTNQKSEVAGIETQTFLDYEVHETGLPKADVVKYILKDGSWFAIRPSGTEPKIKLYISVKSDSAKASAEKLEKIKAVVLESILVEG